MLNFILILLLIYVLFKYIMPNLLPRILMFWLKRGQRTSQARQQQTQKPEGSIDIKYQPPKNENKKARYSKAEYVDFEEIEN